MAASGIFVNVNPTKLSYIMGATGCSGSSYNYVANYDCTRVELYIDTSDKQVNKAVFTALEDQRSVIEAEYGSPLQWQRLEDRAAGSICDQLDGVGIANEDDWPKIIEFHSRKVLN